MKKPVFCSMLVKSCTNRNGMQITSPAKSKRPSAFALTFPVLVFVDFCIKRSSSSLTENSVQYSLSFLCGNILGLHNVVVDALGHRHEAARQRHALVSGAHNPPAATGQFLNAVRRPAGNPRGHKQRREQLLRDFQHVVNKTGIQIHVGADFFLFAFIFREQFRRECFYQLERAEICFKAAFFRIFTCTAF